MDWTTPEYSRSAVKRAGAIYTDPRSTAEDRELALIVINNWRSSHSFPLNTLQMNLRNVASRLDSDPTVAQRIKRLPSIRHKLERFPNMDLARMQDIGGARAVMSSVRVVDEAVDFYLDHSRVKHKLIRHDSYTDSPKTSGYRGVHLVYSYFSDRDPSWNGLKIELQIRTRLQHAWATAVETVGTFTRQALKSSQGEDEWLRFFALMSSELARREKTPFVPGTPTERTELAAEIRRYAAELDVVNRLNAYGATLQFTERASGVRKGHTFLLELDIPAAAVQVRSYRSAAVAAEAYGAIERAIEGNSSKDVVLVSVESLKSLRRAYPNYFLDTTQFVNSVRRAIAE